MYLANPCGPEVEAAMTRGDIGLIETPKQGTATRRRRIIDSGAIWCADNGAYGKGFPGEDAWFAWLQRKAVHADTCLFAVAPDVVGDAAATLERSLPWLPRIRALGYKAAFVGQDGQEDLSVPWDEFDVLFIGGSTTWKLGRHARALVYEAKRRGKWVHMGRVNSQRRYSYARGIGCDSADGTKLTFGPDANLPLVLSWLRSADQGLLDLTGEHP